MRRRLRLTVAVAGAAFVLGAATAVGQEVGGGTGVGAGEDYGASGELLPGGTSAEVGARFESTSSSGGGSSGAGSRGGSGITCQFVPQVVPSTPEFVSLGVADLTAIYEQGGSAPLPGVRSCYDASGQVIAAEVTTWAPGAGGPGAAPVIIDPAVLAEIARSRLVFPGPVVSTSPPAGEGTYAQLPTFFFVENWGDVSERATAGPVTATVTATPVRQTWEIRDTFRGGTKTVSCEGPGAAFDPARPLEEQLPPACGWTPRHSSAGQGQRGGVRGEACFPTTVTLAWDVRWGSNIGAGGALGEGTSSTELCLVVAELQAVVVADG